MARREKQLVMPWIDVIKGWSVVKRGKPSNGRFRFGLFELLVSRRGPRHVHDFSAISLREPANRTTTENAQQRWTPLSAADRPCDAHTRQTPSLVPTTSSLVVMALARVAISDNDVGKRLIYRARLQESECGTMVWKREADGQGTVLGARFPCEF